MTARVLLIEDEPHIVEAMRFILVRDGWTVSTHADGTTALTAIRLAQPDVVVLDLMLPGRSGIEILGDLRRDPGLSGLPVLVLSASGQGSARSEAEAAGATAFIAKPFSNAEVVAAVRALGRP